MVSKREAERIAADQAEVAKVWSKLGDAEATRFAAELYKIRMTPTAYDAFNRMPRVVIVFIALWVGLLETADKLPKLLLTIPQYEATAAEFQAKMMQPEMTKAQLTRAENEAKASIFAPMKAAAELNMTQINLSYAKTVGRYP